MSIYYLKNTLLKGRVKHYVIVNGVLKHRRLSDQWYKSIEQSYKTPFINADCQIIRVHQYRHKDASIPEKIGMVNSVERLSFETDSNGYTTTPVGDIDVTTVSWRDFKRFMGYYFKGSDALHFTLDFARKNSPLMRQMTWDEFDACPDDNTFQHVGTYSSYLAQVSKVKLSEKEAKSSLHKVRSKALHPVYMVHDVECLMYELRQVIGKTPSYARGDLRYMTYNMLWPALSGDLSYRDRPEKVELAISALGYYMDGIYALIMREVLAGYSLPDFEHKMLQRFNKLKGKKMPFDLCFNDMLLRSNAKSLFLPVDFNGYHTVPIFSDYKPALIGFG